VNHLLKLAFTRRRYGRRKRDSEGDHANAKRKKRKTKEKTRDYQEFSGISWGMKKERETV